MADKKNTSVQSSRIEEKKSLSGLENLKPESAQTPKPDADTQTGTSTGEQGGSKGSSKSSDQ